MSIRNLPSCNNHFQFILLNLHTLNMFNFFCNLQPITDLSHSINATPTPCVDPSSLHLNGYSPEKEESENGNEN